MACCAVAGLATFVGVVWALASGWDYLARVDAATAEYFGGIAADDPGWVRAWDLLSDLAGPVIWAVLAAVYVVYLLVRHRRTEQVGQRRKVWFLVVGVVLGSMIPWLMKLVVDRPRPQEASRVAFGSSFPSGHAFGVAIAAGAAITLATLAWRGWRRWLTVVLALVMTVLVCFARLALAVHYVSDVLAGLGLGAAWIATVALVCFAWPHRGSS